MARFYRWIRLGAILVGSIAVGLVLLWSTTLLPGAPIRANVAASAPTLTAEGNHPGRFWLFNTFVGDNFTDALMLNISYRDPGATFSDTLAARYYGGVLDNPVGSLQERVDGGTNGEVEPDAIYERYWHGYLVFTRPALLALTYPQLRVLNAVLLGALLIAALVMMRRRLGWGAPVSLQVALLVIAAPVLVYNLQFVGVFYVAFAGVVAAMWLMGGGERTRRSPDSFDLELFLTLGILASFIDYLTVPVITLGIPLLVLMASEVSAGPRALVRRALRGGLSWAAGYALFWSSKWAIVDITMPDLDGMPVGSNVFNRLGESMGLMDRVWAVAKNIANIVPLTRPVDAPLGIIVDGDFMLYAGLWVGGAVLVVIAAWITLTRLAVRHSGRRPALIDYDAAPGTASAIRSGSLILLAVADLPILWYFVVADHSSVHNYFTYRGLLVFVFAVGLFFTYSIDWQSLWGRESIGVEKEAR